MTDVSDIKRKIAALLAKAEGTDNEYEAATFMAKVNELLERHQLQLHQLTGVEDLMGYQRGEFNVYATITWAKLLIHQIARYYNASSTWVRRNNHYTYDVIGRESNRITTELMVPFIIAQVRQKARLMHKEQNHKSVEVCMREIGHALSVRIHNLIGEEEKKRELHRANTLVPVNELDDFLNSLGVKRSGKTRAIQTTNTANTYAESISLHRQAPNKEGTLAITG